MAPLSYWHDSLEPGDVLTPRPTLPGDRDADVAIVGAGFSGLWSAYYLLQADPSLRVVVLERDTAGFGASGRNGGWCVGDHAAPFGALEREGGPGSASATVREVHAAVDEVGAVAAREQIDCGYAKSGAVYLASNAPQLKRLHKRRAAHERYGLGDVYTFLSPEDASAIVRSEGLVGALFTEHAAALHPARLARGLAVAVERHGGTVYEGTEVRRIEPRRVETVHGTVTAEVIVRATEAYTPSLDGHERTILPIGNFMIATEPIDDATWIEIGLDRRELFEDTQTLLGYGQRTADGRIAWGGLSAPTWWRSKVPPSPMTAPHVADRLRELLVRRFPVLGDIGVTHHWGGVLGVARDLRPSVGLDRTTGLAWAGAYFGQGVAASNAAGHTMADLVTGADTDRTRLPWVNHRSRQWEPEPLRWIGVHTATTLARISDRIDSHR